jgi:hypothetical protein
MKKTILIVCLVWMAHAASAQVKIQRAYKPTTVTPATYNTESPKPVTYNTTTATSDAEARRAAALAKVQGRQSATTAKSIRPAEYGPGGSVAPVTYSAPDPSTTVTVNGENVQRDVRKGRGQVGNELFTPVSELYYVQFAVYCKDTPVDKAPGIDGLYLLWHPGSICPGGAKGASYIVKGYTTADEARAAVSAYKASNIDCWYNPALTGAEVEIIGVR